MGGGVLKGLLTKAAGAVDDTVLDSLLTYKTAGKELKDAINHRIYNENPDLFQLDDYGGAILGEGGTSDIPRLHVDDLKHYFGHTEDIPSRYKRTTGKRDIDELAAMAGYDDVDGIDSYVEAIRSELLSRQRQRESKQVLSEMRNDPKFIKETQDLLNREKAQYAPDPQPYQPSKRDENWYLKNVVIPKGKVHQIPVKSANEGMENFRINRYDVSPQAPPEPPRLQYTPSFANIPVRNLSTPQQPTAAAGVLPLNESRPIPQLQQRSVAPDWRELMANIMTLQAATGAQ